MDINKISSSFKYIALLLLIFSGKEIFATGLDKSRMEIFIENFYTKPDFVVNHPIVGIETGLSFLNFHQFPDENLAGAYKLEAYYGFSRVNPHYDIEGIFSHQSEYFFIGNISSDFKTFSITGSGTKSDTWRFGFGLRDGFGFDLGDDNRFYLNHSTGFVWHHIDVQTPLSTRELELFTAARDTMLIADYDEKIKAGMFHRGGFKFQIAGPLNFTLDAGRSVVFHDLHYGKYLGVWLFDNVTQRWIDIFERDFIEFFGDKWPWVKFLYKNLLSFGVYSFRQNQGYWPFTSQSAVSLNSFSFGLAFIFE